MKIVKTNAGLGYQEEAYFMEVGINKYLCVYLDVKPNTDIYIIGYAYSFDSDEVKCADEFDIKDSPLWGTFCFDYFLENDRIQQAMQARQDAKFLGNVHHSTRNNSMQVAHVSAQQDNAALLGLLHEALTRNNPVEVVSMSQVVEMPKDGVTLKAKGKFIKTHLKNALKYSERTKSAFFSYLTADKI